MGNRLGRWLLLLGALGLALAGQYYFAKKPDFFWDGVSFYALGMVLFLALIREARVAAAPVVRAPLTLTRETVIRAILAGFALLLGLAVLVQLNSPHDSYWPIFWQWVAAIAIFLLAFVPLPGWASGVARGTAGRQDAGAWRARLGMALRRNGWEWGLVLLLVVGAFVLRAWRIDSIPWTLGGDEGSQGLWARDVLEGRLTDMFATGWLSVPNLSFFWQAAWLKTVGDNVTGLRLPWAVVGTLTVLGGYLLVRRLFDRGLALLFAFLLAAYHYHIHYSRLGSNQVADPLFMVWTLLFMVIAWQDKKRWAWVAAGIVAGLAFYFYAGSRQVLIILGAGIAWAILTEPAFWREHRDDLLALLGGLAVAGGPMLLYALRFPDDFNARLNQVGIIQSGWLDREVGITGKTRLALVAEQFRRAFFAFNYFKDRVVWYGADIPLLDFFASIFFIFGLVFSVTKLIKWRYAIFVLWFVLVVALGGALTESPPSSQRLVSSALPAIFFVAVALRELSRLFGEVAELPELGRRIITGGLAIALALISIRFYFGPYQESWVYGSFNGEVATRIGYELRDLGPTWKEYFFGAPRMYADFGSSPFIAKGVPLYDVKEPISGPPDFVDNQQKAIFIFLPERLGELALVQQKYPSGTLQEVHRVGEPDGPLLYTAYLVPNP